MSGYHGTMARVVLAWAERWIVGEVIVMMRRRWKLKRRARQRQAMRAGEGLVSVITAASCMVESVTDLTSRIGARSSPTSSAGIVAARALWWRMARVKIVVGVLEGDMIGCRW